MLTQNSGTSFVKDFDRYRQASLSLALVLLMAWAPCPLPAQPPPESGKPEEATRPGEWRATSTQGFFNVALTPQGGEVQIGKFQVWELRLTDAEGQQIFPARFAIGGGMQGHGHGLPTQPRVTNFLPDGRYIIEGMKFNMAGDWTLFFAIEAELGPDRILHSDQVQVDLTVDY